MLAHPDVLQRLQPQLLLFHFDPTAGHGREHLAGFREIAQIAEGSQCALELVVPAQRNVKDELREIAAMASEAKLKLSAVLVSPAVDRQSTLPGSPWPPCPPLAEIYQAAREAFPGVAIGGGMLTYFTELNRKRPPVELLDFVSHCTCPIVHAADDLSVMQTLEAMPSITRSARAIMGKDKPYWIGPSTIGMRQNPYGSRVMDNPENRRITMTDHDPRQTSLFAAAWMIGYAASTAEAHLQVLTVGALTGPLGTGLCQRRGRDQLPSRFLHGARSFRHGWTSAVSLPLEPARRCCCRSGQGSRWESPGLAGQSHWTESNCCPCRPSSDRDNTCAGRGSFCPAACCLARRGLIDRTSALCRRLLTASERQLVSAAPIRSPPA